MWMIDIQELEQQNLQNGYIYVFDYQDYNRQLLLDEAYSRQYEPFEVPMDDINSDPNWFEIGKDVHMDNWTQARFFGEQEDGTPQPAYTLRDESMMIMRAPRQEFFFSSLPRAKRILE